MIPQIIHYCWFGGNQLPEVAKANIESWKHYLPNYTIKEWNEDTFDVYSNEYVREAYTSKKWAFITDYVRLYALSTEGGVYMDTDVEVIKCLDPFLEEKGFSGFERVNAVPTGIMAAEKGHPFINELLHEYDNLRFIKDDGEMDLTTNVVRITNTSVKHGLRLDNTKQTICDFTYYPKDFFCPKNPRTHEIELTENTVTIHHFAGSWDTEKKFRKKMKKVLPTPIKRAIVKVMDFAGIN